MPRKRHFKLRMYAEPTGHGMKLVDDIYDTPEGAVELVTDFYHITDDAHAIELVPNGLVHVFLTKVSLVEKRRIFAHRCRPNSNEESVVSDDWFLVLEEFIPVKD